MSGVGAAAGEDVCSTVHTNRSYARAPSSPRLTVCPPALPAGLAEGRRGFNWLLVLRFFLGWVATLVVAGLTSALFTAQGIYSPSNAGASQRTATAFYLGNTTQDVATVGAAYSLLPAACCSAAPGGVPSAAVCMLTSLDP